MPNTRPSSGSDRGGLPSRPLPSHATSGGAQVLQGEGQQLPEVRSHEHLVEHLKILTGCTTEEEHIRGGASCHNDAVKFL